MIWFKYCWQRHREKCLYMESSVWSNRECFMSEVFQGIIRTLQMWCWGPWIQVSLLLRLPRFQFSQSQCDVDFQRWRGAEERGFVEGDVKVWFSCLMTCSSTYLEYILSYHCCKTLVHFQGSKKLVLMFTSVFMAYMRKKFFWTSLFHQFHWFQA